MSYVSTRRSPQDRPKAKKKADYAAAKWVISLVLTAVVTAFIFPSMFRPIVKTVSHKHSLTGFVDMKQKNPNCTIWTFSIFPLETIKSLNMIVHLNQPISQDILENGLDVNTNPTHSVRASVNAACEILTKSSDVNGSLTFNLSSDRREIVIKGHDLSSYDTQTFVGVFNQNSTTPLDPDIMGHATYEAFGYELPAIIQLINQQSGKAVIIQ